MLQVQLNRFSVLFTGDIGLSTEKNLIKHYNLKSDILKVGHHGSDTSTGEEFKNEVNPVISLISAGENNRYGHPHDSVTERLRDTRILGTNTLGMVEFSINHDTICIRAKLAPDQDECLKKDIKSRIAGPDQRILSSDNSEYLRNNINDSKCYKSNYESQTCIDNVIIL